MLYKLVTYEIVHGVYVVEADNLTALAEKVEKGDLPAPEVYEATDVQIDYVDIDS